MIEKSTLLPLTLPYEASLQICDLSLWVHLGIREIEKTERQEVRLNVQLYFSEAPSASKTDSIKDTVCYHELADDIVESVEAKRYDMLEKLAEDIKALLKPKLTGQMWAQITLHKIHPPISRLQGGVKYTLNIQN